MCINNETIFICTLEVCEMSQNSEFSFLTKIVTRDGKIQLASYYYLQKKNVSLFKEASS